MLVLSLNINWHLCFTLEKSPLLNLCLFLNADHSAFFLQAMLFIWPLYMTSLCDPYIWPLYSSAKLANLSQLSTFLRFCQKRNFFGALKICSVSMWHIMWLLLFTLSILFWSSSSSSVTTRLTILQHNYRKKCVC